MSKYQFARGDEVVYVLSHADGPDHPGTETGVVRHAGVHTEGEGRGYFVDFKDGSNVAKLTFERDLRPVDE